MAKQTQALVVTQHDAKGPYISPEIVVKYAKHAAYVNKAEKWLKVYREAIIVAFDGGARCPKTTPYMLELSDEDRVSPAWKDELHAYIASKEGVPAADAYLAKVKLNTVPTPIRKLTPKINVDYRGGN